jgi:hypothetical protein
VYIAKGKEIPQASDDALKIGTGRLEDRGSDLIIDF